MSVINSSVFQGGDAGRTAASQIASQVKSSASGMSSADVAALADALREGSKGTAAKREGACMAVEAIASTAKATAEHNTVTLVADLVKCCADKHSKEVQTASSAALTALAKSMSAHGLRAVLPALLAAMDPKEKWQTMKRMVRRMLNRALSDAFNHFYDSVQEAAATRQGGGVCSACSTPGLESTTTSSRFGFFKV